MIPVCNRTTFLAQAIESVVRQDISADEMQICIVDNSTKSIDWQSLLSPAVHARVSVCRVEDHLPIIENWNRCVSMATGHLIHILHDDDYVLPGFYAAIGKQAAIHGGAALFAARCFHADEAGHYVAVSQRLPLHEFAPALDITAFFVLNHIQSVAVAVRRTFFEQHGGFDPAYGHTADWELFTRAITLDGGMVLPDVLGVYRLHGNSDTGAGIRFAKNIRDEARLMNHFAVRFPAFPRNAARHRLFLRVVQQEERFEQLQDQEAVAAHREFRRELASWENLPFRIKRWVRRFYSSVRSQPGQAVS